LTSWHLPHERSLATGAVISAIRKGVVVFERATADFADHVNPCIGQLGDHRSLDVEPGAAVVRNGSGDGHDRSNGSCDVIADFITPTANGRTDRGSNCGGAVRSHLVNQRSDDACSQPSAATMQDAKHARAWIGQRDERAIGGESGYSELRDRRDKSVDFELSVSVRVVRCIDHGNPAAVLGREPDCLRHAQPFEHRAPVRLDGSRLVTDIEAQV